MVLQQEGAWKIFDSSTIERTQMEVKFQNSAFLKIWRVLGVNEGDHDRFVNEFELQAERFDKRFKNNFLWEVII